MSSRGRRRQDPAPAGAAHIGWALLVIAAALIGGLAAATLVHASLTIAVIVSVVVGGIGVVALFRSPARPPEPMAGDQEDADTGRYPVPRRPAPPVPQAPRSASPASFPAGPVAPGPVAPARPSAMGRAAAARPPGPRPWSSCCRFRRSRETWTAGRALVGFGPGGAAAAERGRQAGARSGPVHIPGIHLHRAVPALRRVPARHPAGQQRLGFPLRVLRVHLDLAAGHAVAAGPGHAP